MELTKTGRFPRLPELAGLAAVAAAAAAVLLFNIQNCGWGNSYYAAGVKSMLESPSNFFFAAYDPSGFVSIDKPPLGFWLQTLSAVFFGYTGFSLFLPQLLATWAGVLMLYGWLRPRVKAFGALAAGFLLAVIPIVSATARNNTIDALLVPVFIGIGWLLTIAVERQKIRYLYLAFVLLGLGFNIKMMEVLLIAPAMAVTFFWYGGGSWIRRVGHLAGGAAVFLVLGLSWAVAVDATPPSQRPFVGSTQENSEFELILGHNGLDRLGLGHGRENDRGQGFERRGDRPEGFRPAAGVQNELRQLGFNTSRPGVFRFFENDSLAGQTAWLLVFAAGSAAVFFWTTRKRAGPTGAAYHGMTVFLSTWFVTEIVYFSATGGMFHTYYLVTMAPSVAALAGIGLALWRETGSPLVKRTLALAAGLALAVQALLLWYAFPNSWPWMAAVGAAVLLALVGWFKPRIALLAPLGLVLLAAAPASLSVANLFVPGEGSNPVARWTAANPRQSEHGPAKLTLFLIGHPTSAALPIAVPSSRQFADSMIIQDDAHVVPLGGFTGADPVMSLSDFTARAAKGQIGFALVPQASGTAPRSGEQRNEPIFEWVREHGRLVPPDQWRNAEDRAGTSEEGGRIPGARDQLIHEDLYALAGDIVL